MSDYKRIIITGILTTQSNFHIGTGKEETADDQTLFNQLCLDNKGNPYIPASSLRGYLRNIILNQLGDNAVSDLFGLARQASNNTEMGKCGLIRIHDCRWDSGKYDKELISQTSIDPVTGAAKHHHLSTHAIIPAKSRFIVHIELDNANDQHLKNLHKALQTFNENNKGKLGKGKSTGQGECHWALDEKGIKVLTSDKLKEWLKPAPTKPNKKYKKKDNIKPEKLLAEYFEELDIESIAPFKSKQSTITIRLKADSPILINDPHAVKKREADNKTADKQQPKLMFKQQSKQAIIPGSTLKGWVRARGRRIILTLLNAPQKGQDKEKIADSLLDNIFGSTQQQSYLYFNDAKVEFVEDDIHPQTFTAIDRFTGGVKDGALYNVEAIWPENHFLAQLQQVKKLQGWMKLLMLYILRDSMEGDLVLGWGKSKGYGRLQLDFVEYSGWDDLYSSIDKTELERWDNELQQKLQGESA